MSYAEQLYNICPSCKTRSLPKFNQGITAVCCQNCKHIIEIEVEEQKSTYNKHEKLQLFLDSLNEDELGYLEKYLTSRSINK